jgi:hypothetical protein
MANKCAKCKLAHSAGDSIACTGPCERIFHLKCLDVSRDVLKALSECRNLCYTCDACLLHCYRPLEDKLENLETELRELKTLVTAALSTASASTAASNAPPQKPTIQRKQQPHRAVKKSTTFADIVNDQFSTPMGRDTPTRPPVADTPTTPAAIVGTGPKKPEINLAAPKFWVYLTGLDPETDDDILDDSIKTTFQTDDIKCVKLLPKNRPLEQCEFISFKIGFPQSMKDTALNPAFWPEGFSVREFRDRNQQSSSNSSNFRRFTHRRTPQRYFRRPRFHR